MPSRCYKKPTDISKAPPPVFSSRHNAGRVAFHQAACYEEPVNVLKCCSRAFDQKFLSPEGTWSHVCEHCSHRVRLCLTLSVDCTHVALTDLINHAMMDLPVTLSFRPGESLSVPLWETLLLCLKLGRGTTLSGSEALRTKSRKSWRSAPKPSEKVPSRVMVNYAHFDQTGLIFICF